MVSDRILLVEDDLLIRTLMAEFLRDNTFKVTEACNGDEAADLLAGPETFDVVLTDVRMPGTMDGVDVAIRAREKHPGVPIVMVSGYAVQLMDRLSGLNPPATFIRKPFKPSEILDVLWRLTPKA